jgi:hypothetical protein
MTILRITVVPAAPESEAAAMFERWCDEHPELRAILTDDMLVGSRVRGPGPAGNVISKRTIDVLLDDSRAAMLVAESEWILNVVVVEAEPDEADRIFRAWCVSHPRLSDFLGDQCFQCREIVRQPPQQRLRQYSVRLSQTQSSLLVPEAASRPVPG